MMHFSLSCAEGSFGKSPASVCFWPNSAVCLPERIKPAYTATEWCARSLGPGLAATAQARKRHARNLPRKSAMNLFFFCPT